MELSLQTRWQRAGLVLITVLASALYVSVVARVWLADHLESVVKSQDIVSASGPRLVVQDAKTKQLLASTDDLLGTSGWRQESAEFATGPGMRLVILQVMRVPGNPLIKGTFWLDDVTLTPVLMGSVASTVGSSSP